MGQDCQSVADKDDGGDGMEVGIWGGVEVGNWGGSPLSAEVFLCRVSHIFSLFAVALVVWLVAVMTFGAGGCALLPMVDILLVRPRRPGLEKEHTENIYKKNK